MFLTEDEGGSTVCHVAAMWGSLKILHTLWEWAKDLPKPEETIKTLFLDRNTYGRTAWVAAEARGNHEVLRKMLEWAEEVLTPDEINNMMLSGE
jgi:hypothetical protein